MPCRSVTCAEANELDETAGESRSELGDMEAAAQRCKGREKRHNGWWLTEMRAKKPLPVPCEALLRTRNVTLGAARSDFGSHYWMGLQAPNEKGS